MKNLKGILCYSAGILFSVLTFAWYALAGYSATMKMGSQKSDPVTMTVYKMLTTENNLKENILKVSNVFSIIALVFACLTAVACVLGLLNQLGVLKFDWLKWVVVGCAALFVVMALVAMITMIVWGADNSTSETYMGTTYASTVSCGVGLILTLVSSVLALVASIVPSVGKKD